MADWEKGGGDTDNVHSGPGSKGGKKGTSGSRGGDAGSATEKTHDVEFAKGGNTKMFGEQAAGDQVAAKTGKSPTSAPGAEFAKGGSGKMFGFAGSQPAQSGITSAR